MKLSRSTIHNPPEKAEGLEFTSHNCQTVVFITHYCLVLQTLHLPPPPPLLKIPPPCQGMLCFRGTPVHDKPSLLESPTMHQCTPTPPGVLPLQGTHADVMYCVCALKQQIELRFSMKICVDSLHMIMFVFAHVG